MATILDKIKAYKLDEIAAAKRPAHWRSLKTPRVLPPACARFVARSDTQSKADTG